MKKRRQARELALQILYACDIGGDEDRMKVFETIAGSRPYSSDVREYSHKIVTSAWDSLSEIDALIRKHAVNWDLKRMAAVDRNVLRIAVAELRHCGETPPKVVMDEAVELAKIFSTEESSRFVNGVVDAVYKELSAPLHRERERNT
jgi:N utilization substance protein B